VSSNGRRKANGVSSCCCSPWPGGTECYYRQASAKGRGTHPSPVDDSMPQSALALNQHAMLGACGTSLSPSPSTNLPWPRSLERRRAATGRDVVALALINLPDSAGPLPTGGGGRRVREFPGAARRQRFAAGEIGSAHGRPNRDLGEPRRRASRGLRAVGASTPTPSFRRFLVSNHTNEFVKPRSGGRSARVAPRKKGEGGGAFFLKDRAQTDNPRFSSLPDT